MVEEEKTKTAEAAGPAPIQVQTSDVEVAKLQLAARWAEMAITGADIEERLKTFHRAYKAIDDALQV